MSEKQPFEKILSDLQAIIEELESENLSLDKMVHLFEDGMKLMKVCKEHLSKAEGRITTLIKTHDEFSRLNGVGLQKLNKYAEIFIKVINTQN